MTYQFSNLDDSPVRVVQSILRITETLGLYRAELARILGIQCGDIGELFSGKRNLVPGSCVWRNALMFIQLYGALCDTLKDDDVAIFNWLRRENTDLGGVPLLLMVDEGKLEKVLEFITGNDSGGQ